MHHDEATVRMAENVVERPNRRVEQPRIDQMMLRPRRTARSINEVSAAITSAPAIEAGETRGDDCNAGSHCLRSCLGSG